MRASTVSAMALGLAMTGAGGLPTPADAAMLDWPDITAPPRSQVEWVARDAKVNGLPTRIERFQTELTPDEVIAHYRRAWKDARVGPPREFAPGAWKAISTWRGKFQLAVQVQGATRGSQGLISVVSFADKPSGVLPAEWPRWPDTRITQVTESEDGPVRSHLVAMVSGETLDVNVARWRDTWQRRGFMLTFEQKTPADADRGWMGSFSRGAETVDVVLAWREQDRRTFITVNALRPVDGGAP